MTYKKKKTPKEQEYEKEKAKTIKVLEKEIVDIAETQTAPKVRTKVIWSHKGVGLNYRVNLFIAHYLANGFFAGDAAFKAGYSKTSAKSIGNQLLLEATVKEEVERVVEKKLEELDITADWKMSILKEVAEKCLVGENLKDGFMVPQGVISSVAELNRMQGHYSPDKNLNFNANVEVDDVVFARLIEKNEKDH